MTEEKKEVKTEQKRIGELTPEALEALKTKTRGRVYLVEITDEDEVHCLYLRRPDFNVLKAVSAMSKTDELESSLVFLRNCRVAGSDAVLEDGVLALAAAQAAASLLTSAKASLKNV